MVLPLRVVLTLAILAVALMLASTLGQVVKYETGHDRIYGLVQLFHHDSENNVPTFFSTVILLISTILLSIITTLKKKERDSYAFHWGMLAIIFLFLSMDEASSIHELLNNPMRKMVEAKGVFYYAWIIPYIALVFLFTLSYFRFWLHMPKQTQFLFAIAGFAFLGGAIGMEIIGGLYVELHGYNNLTYNLISTVEEGLEITGIILFVYALLNYMSTHYESIQFKIGQGHDRPLI